MKKISAKANPQYKRLRSLLQGKYRQQWGQYLMEGEKVVREALTGGWADRVIVREDRQSRFSFLPSDALILEASLFDTLSQTRHNQGIMALVRQQDHSKESFWQGVRSGGSILVLDRVQDPGNVGTIIRTAEAAGYGGVLLLQGSVDVYSPKVVRSASGSLLRLPLRWVENQEAVVEELREQGKKIIATAAGGNPNFRDVDYTDSALILGNEGNGVSPYFLDRADEKVALPMEGKIESLNVAVAAGILMYQ